MDNNDGPDTEGDDDEEDRGTIAYPETDQDLYVDDNAWSTLPDDHKFAANTGSFTFVTDHNSVPLDVFSLTTT